MTDTFTYNHDDAAKKRAAEKITILDQDYHQAVRNRGLRRGLRAAVRAHDKLIEQSDKAEKDDDLEQYDELQEQLLEKRCEIIALVVSRRANGEDHHPPADQMAEELDPRDIEQMFYGLLGSTAAEPVPTTEATQS